MYEQFVDVAFIVKVFKLFYLQVALSRWFTLPIYGFYFVLF